MLPIAGWLQASRHSSLVKAMLSPKPQYRGRQEQRVWSGTSTENGMDEMRINLTVRYEERSQAKALGARWDAARKTWYVINPEDMAPLLRWMPGTKFTECPPEPQAPIEREERGRSKWRRDGLSDLFGKAPGKEEKRLAYQEKMRQGFATPRTDHSLPDCGCSHVAPWEHCDHSMPWPVLDADQAAHMKSITKE